MGNRRKALKRKPDPEANTSEFIFFSRGLDHFPDASGFELRMALTLP
jgi:hypothetical protein